MQILPNSDDLRSGLLISSLLATFVGAAAAFISFVVFRDRSKSHYDELRREAKLSAMRESFERQLQSITSQMMASEQRWRDVNHLLISAQQRQPEKPSVEAPRLTRFFRAAGITDIDMIVDRRLVLVLTPFDEAFEKDFLTIAEVCRGAGFHCVRGDEENISGDILPHILRLMAKSRLIIANISSRNPNVYYELGIAQAMDKPTILVSRNISEVPFDIKTRRILIYEDQSQLKRQLIEMIARVSAEALPASFIVPDNDDIIDMFARRVQDFLKQTPWDKNYKKEIERKIHDIADSLGLTIEKFLVDTTEGKVNVEIGDYDLEITPSSTSRAKTFRGGD
jgi:hypothetical protein